MEKTKVLKKFKYEKNPGDVSHREVFILGVPSDNYFGIDLSEFNDKDKQFYLHNLELLSSQFDQAINELGLKQNYRLFKKLKVRSA